MSDIDPAVEAWSSRDNSSIHPCPACLLNDVSLERDKHQGYYLICNNTIPRCPFTVRTLLEMSSVPEAILEWNEGFEKVREERRKNCKFNSRKKNLHLTD